MKTNFYRAIFSFLFIVLLVQTACSPKLPEGFPAKVVSFEVKLATDGQPVKGASISLIPDGVGTPYLVTAFTDANGVAKMETSLNAFSKSGAPAGKYNAVIAHTPKAPSELTQEEMAKLSNDEITARRKKAEKEIAAMPVLVPPTWATKCPVKITIPESGGKVAVETTDPKTFEQ
ncbi:MAG: hypothetical protein LBT05_14535 [Planctomycetaceae bacterium]|jgi:hypothetical protein|nr:hypothetical protein [Planctomycetaceae bacterium]